MKICPLGDKLCFADGWAEITKLVDNMCVYVPSNTTVIFDGVVMIFLGSGVERTLTFISLPYFSNVFERFSENLFLCCPVLPVDDGPTLRTASQHYSPLASSLQALHSS
jgi:hypothetical protein